MSIVKELQEIFDEVYNGNFTYTSEDREHWASEEDLVGSIKDDCDGGALYCRKKCRERGIKSRLVYCKYRGQGHLVLEVKGWILDNRQSRVVQQQKLPYEWISISGYEKGDDWRKLN